MGHRAHLGHTIWILSLSEVSRKRIWILTYEVARLIIWLIRSEEWPSPWPSLFVLLEQIGGRELWGPEWSLGAGNLSRTSIVAVICGWLPRFVCSLVISHGENFGA